MAHFPYIRAIGTWITGTDVTPTEFEDINLYIYKSINGDDGGTWAPTDPIVIGGDGIHVTALANLDLCTVTDLTVLGAGKIDVGFFGTGADVNLKTGSELIAESGSSIRTDVGSVLDVNGTCTMDGASTITGVMTFAATCDPIVQSGCAWTFQSGSAITIAVGAGINLDGAITQSSTGLITQAGAITKSGISARCRDRVSTLGNNAAHILDVDFDQYLYTQTDATARVQTLRVSTSPVPNTGERMDIRVVNTGGAIVYFQNEGSANYVCYSYYSCTLGFIFDGTIWRLTRSGYNTGTNSMFYGADA